MMRWMFYHPINSLCGFVNPIYLHFILWANHVTE